MRANTWQFPILAKYGLPIRHVRPYAVAGYAASLTRGSGSYTSISVVDLAGTKVLSTGTFSADYDTGHGLVAGGGIQFGGRHLRIAPEFRFIRWKDPLYSFYGSRGFYFLVPQNEAQLLVGVSWH